MKNEPKPSVLQAAKLKLQQLEELEAAEDALEDAQQAPRSAERLRRALRDAEAAGLSEDGNMPGSAWKLFQTCRRWR